MTEQEKRVARRTIKYLKEHGLDFDVTCNLGVEVPAEIQACVDSYFDSCFPTDPDAVAEQVIDMIEESLKE